MARAGWLASAALAAAELPSQDGLGSSTVTASEQHVPPTKEGKEKGTGAVLRFAGPSFGGGIGFGAAVVDYAFVPFGGLGATHRVSLTIGF